MSVASTIYDALKQVDGLPSISYYDSPITTFPKLVFFLVSNYSFKLSNKKHHQRAIYQVSYFSKQPLDVEDDEKLVLITNTLEGSGLSVGDWQEATQPDESLNVVGYHYYVEVRK